MVNDKLEVLGRFYKDVVDIARCIEFECMDVLLPAPKGIYSINRSEPVMVDGQEYYTLVTDKQGLVTRTVVSDITDIKDRIYTTEGNAEVVVIPASFMNNKAKYLSREPILPYRGIKVVEALVNDQINKFLKYAINPNPDELIYQQFINPFGDICSDFICDIDPWYCRINAIYEPLYYDLRDFLSNNDWNIYFIKMEQARLKIERTIDYRAYQWIKHQEELDYAEQLKLQE